VDYVEANAREHCLVEQVGWFPDPQGINSD